MTVHDVERAWRDEWSRLVRIDQFLTGGLRGLNNALRGITSASGADDGPRSAPGSRPPGGAFAPSDDPDRDLHRLEQAMRQLVSARATIEEVVIGYQRLDLDHVRDDSGRIMTVDPARRPTSDERKIAQSETLDDNWCRSCLRVDNFTLAGDGGLCSSCTELLKVCKALDEKSKAVLPPVTLVELRRDGKRIYDSDYRAAISTSAKKRRART